MPIPANLITTAMAIMPHTDAERALEMTLSMDVPFWPELPNYSYREYDLVNDLDGLYDLVRRAVSFGPGQIRTLE